MDYKEIIINGYNGRFTTPYADYFESEAQKVQRDEFIRFNTFFNSCQQEAGNLKRNIEEQFKKDAAEQQFMIDYITESLNKKGYVEYRDESGGIRQETDRGIIEESLKCYTNQRDSIDIENYHYVDKDKDYYERENDPRFSFAELTKIEQAIQQAKATLTGNQTEQTSKARHQPPQITIPDNILNELQKQGLIENAAARSLKWLRTKILLAYFVDVANDKLHLKYGNKRVIKPFETLFNESGLGNCINEYKNKTGQKPVGYKVIDEIMS
jgi:hypothetical protein